MFYTQDFEWNKNMIVSIEITTHQARSTSRVGTATLMGYTASMWKYRSYFVMRRLIVEETVGEWIQSIACIFSMKELCRMTAPTRSRAKIEEFSQYRDIIRRVAIFSVRCILFGNVLWLTFRTIEWSAMASSINLRILSTVAEGLKRGSVSATMVLASHFLMSRFGNSFGSCLSWFESSGRPKWNSVCVWISEGQSRAFLPSILNIVPGIGTSFRRSLWVSLRNFCALKSSWSTATLQDAHRTRNCLSENPCPVTPDRSVHIEPAVQVVHGTGRLRLQPGHSKVRFGGSWRLFHAYPVSDSKSWQALSLAVYSKELLSMQSLIAAKGSPSLQKFIFWCLMQSSRKSRGFSK